MQQGQPNSRGRHFVELSHGVLVVTILVALVFIILLSRESIKQRSQVAQLRSTLATSMGTISGPPEAQRGDIVPAFEGINLNGKARKVVYDGKTRHVLFIFSAQCDVCLREVSTWNSIVRKIKNVNYSALGMMLASASITVPPVDFDLVSIPDISVQRAYRVVAIPLIMVVSEHGKVEWVHYGEISETMSAELLSVIEADPNSKSK